MTKATTHSSQDAAAGVLFQFERALLHFAPGRTGTLVGIETGEDVVVKRGNQQTLFEEDKLSFQRTGHPLTDRSKNLWNTLWIWLKKLDSIGETNDKVQLSLVTTRPVGACLVR